MKSVPFINLAAIHDPLREALLTACARVLDAQAFIGGEEVAAFERAFASAHDVTGAIGVSSGTDALLAVLMTLGVGPGDEVITTPFTFFATAGCIARVGATPVFADIDPVTFNLDPACVARAITDRTRAIIPVHLFGQVAPIAPLEQIIGSRPIAIIEDAAQAVGAVSAEGVAGSLGDAGCFSFFPTKNLGGFGDGGMITSGDEEFLSRARITCRHGAHPKYHHGMIGGNFRLDAMQAAMLKVKLEHLAEWTAMRQANASLYDAILAPYAEITTPGCEDDGAGHVYNQYCVLVDQRDEVRAALTELGVGTNVYYPAPLHRQACFAQLGYARGSLPVAERTCERILALPIWPGMDEAMVEYVAASLVEVVGRLRGE